MSQTQPQEQIQIPTKDQLKAQVSGLIAQRSQAKDQIESIEKQLPVVNGMLQLLVAQEKLAEQQAAAKAAAAKAELNKD